MGLNDDFDNLAYYFKRIGELVDELKRHDYDKRYRHSNDSQVIEQLLEEKIEELKTK